MDVISFTASSLWVGHKTTLSHHSSPIPPSSAWHWKWKAQIQTDKRPTFIQKETAHGKSLIAAAKGGLPTRPDSCCCCCCCGRRHSLAALLAALAVNVVPKSAGASSADKHKLVTDAVHPTRAVWYEEFYAAYMDAGMKLYEMQLVNITRVGGDFDKMESNKAQLFSSIDTKARDFLELGIGTGPNFKYYASRPDISIIGVDPNQHMEKYARVAASKAGLQDSQFKFVRAVGEALPVGASSMDVVIGTLVLCSVTDVAATLKEVRRVLRPGGLFLFVEHVAAPVGSSLRFWQDILDPLQQFVADGCHLTRNTQDYIQDASFAGATIKNINVPSISLISPHIIGVAQA